MSDIVKYVMGFGSGGAVTSAADLNALLNAANTYTHSKDFTSKTGESTVKNYAAAASGMSQADTLAQLISMGYEQDTPENQAKIASLRETELPKSNEILGTKETQDAQALFDKAYAAATQTSAEEKAKLPWQQQLQLGYLDWQHGATTKDEYSKLANQVMLDNKVDEIYPDTRMQINLFGNNPDTSNSMQQLSEIGNWTIFDPEKTDTFESVLNNPMTHVLATFFAPGWAQAALAGVQMAHTGKVTPEGVLEMANGIVKDYTSGLAADAARANPYIEHGYLLEGTPEFADYVARHTQGALSFIASKGADEFKSLFPETYNAIADTAQSVKDLGTSAVAKVKGAATDAVDELKDALGMPNAVGAARTAAINAGIGGMSNIATKWSPTDEINAPDVADLESWKTYYMGLANNLDNSGISAPDTSWADYYRGLTNNLDNSGLEKIIVSGSQGKDIVDTVLNAAAGAPAVVSSATDGTGQNTSSGTITYGTETPTWKASNSAILKFLASNPSQAAIDAAKAQYHVSDEDIAKAKETEVVDVKGKNTGVADSQFPDLPPGTEVVDVKGKNTGVEDSKFPAPPDGADVIDVYGSTAGPVIDTQLPGVDAVIPTLITKVDPGDKTITPTDKTKIKMPSGGGAPPAVDTPQTPTPTPTSLAMPKPTEIDPYTWESIFRNKEQAKKYISPFDRGDEVAYDDISQMLRDMLRS